MCSRSLPSPLHQVVPRGLDGKRRIEHDLFHSFRHFMYGLAEPSLGGLVWLGQIEVVRPKLPANIRGENLCPRCSPDSLCKYIVIWLPLSLDVRRQRGSQITMYLHNESGEHR